VKYGKNRALTLLKIITWIPEILIRIKHENKWFRQFLNTESVDAVISDNRYGLYDGDVFSIFMTHQLCIKSSSGRWADRLLQRINYRAINRFSLCWVPDLEEDPEKDGNKEHALAGELSHPKMMPHIPTRYIGLLSRFEPCIPEGTGGGETRAAGMGLGGGPSGTAPLLILLSGPEPQRSIFEKKILGQLKGYAGKVVLVRGLPGAGVTPALSAQSGGETGIGTGRTDAEAPTVSTALTIHNHLPSAALNRIVCEAGLVISRPGYSSIMDLLKLRKKCIFVPTPGQTEQEYLGDHLADRKLAVCMPQRRFSLSHALALAKDFPFADAGAGNDLMIGNTDRGLPMGEAVAAEIQAQGEAKASPTVLQSEIRLFLEMLAAQRK